jgi:hypothetical protein
MKKQPTKVIRTCRRKECGTEFDANTLKRTHGEHSSVYRMGYCSAQCYTKDAL